MLLMFSTSKSDKKIIFFHNVQKIAVFGKDKKVNICYNLGGGESDGFSTDSEIYSTA